MKGTKPQLIVDNGAIRSNRPAPSWMSADAKREWRRVFPSLADRKILTAADLGGLENYCVACGRVRELERAIQLAGAAIDPVVIRLQDKAMQTARQLAAELGLTPVSRSRPAMRDDSNESDDDNPLAIS